MRDGKPTLWQVLGPGLLFAGAAIGVSHLIQSTRAGALYGLALIPAMLLIHLLKYPGISAGARYAGATGRTLIDAYRATGPVTLWAAGGVVFITAVPIQAALASVTAAVAAIAVERGAGVSVPGPSWLHALALQLVAGALVAAGGFKWVDRVMKLLITAMALTTLAAAALVLPRLDWGTLALLPRGVLDGPGLTFFLAFLGWMPAPLDVAIWNSLWSVEKHRGLTEQPGPGLVKVEFLLGYAKCIALSAAFIVIGAALLHAPGVEVKDGPGLLRQLFDAYAAVFPGWIAPIVAVCAFAVMFSTLLASTDALPRIMAAFLSRRPPQLQTMPHTGTAHVAPPPGPGLRVAVAVLIGLATLALVLTHGRRGAFLAIVDFATVLSFLSTPVLAVIHHRLMHGPLMPQACRPRRWETALSYAAIAAFVAFAGVYAVDFARGLA